MKKTLLALALLWALPASAQILDVGPSGVPGVTGPASAVSGHIATFNGTTGQIIQDGGAAPTGTVSSVTCNGVAITTSGTCSTIGQVPGTTTNDSATAGNVGEYITASLNRGSVITLSSGVTGNITNVSLTAGDWDVNWTACGNVTAATTILTGVTSTSATLPSTPNVPSNGQANYQADGTYTGDVCFSGMARFLLSGTTTVYVAANINGTTPGAYGSIVARRAR